MKYILNVCLAIVYVGILHMSPNFKILPNWEQFLVLICGGFYLGFIGTYIYNRATDDQKPN